MDMNRAFFLKKEDRKPTWRLIDAKDQVLGRVATQIVETLRGKDKATYTPHTDAGDYVVVINAAHIKLTGDKLEGKIYDRYTGWMSGYRTTTAGEYLKKDPAFLIEHAVKGMLPKNKLSDQIIKKLKVYAGETHPHQAHAPVVTEVKEG